MNRLESNPTQYRHKRFTNRMLHSAAYPWVVVLMSCLFLFYKYIAQVSPSVMTDDLMRHFALHATGFAELIAVYFPAYLVAQLLAGPLLDRFSARWLSCFAILLMSVSVFEFSQASLLWQGYLWRACMGVGAAFATVSYLKLAAVWFSDKKFAYVSGWLATAASMGGMMAQTPVAYSIERVGWQQTLSFCSLLGVVVAVIYLLLVRDDKPGVLQAPGHSSGKKDASNFKQLLKSKKVWLLALYSGLAWSPMAVFSGLWGNSFIQTVYHVGKVHAASLVTLSFVGLAVGGPLFGWLASRWGNLFRAMLVGLCISSISLCYVVFTPYANLGLLSVALFLFGFGTGAFMVGFALGRKWFSVALAATLVSVVNSGDALFGAFTEPLIGKLLDHVWHGTMLAGVPIYSESCYRWAMAALPLYLVAAFLVVWVLRRNYSSDVDDGDRQVKKI